MALYRGVHCLPFNISSDNVDVEEKAMETVRATGVLEVGDKVLLTRGSSQGNTNVLKILTV